MHEDAVPRAFPAARRLAVAAALAACVASLAVAARRDAFVPTPSSFVLESPGNVRPGAPLYRHPYRAGDESVTVSRGSGSARVVAYDGHGAVEVVVDDGRFDAEASDVTVFRRGCRQGVAAATSGRGCPGRRPTT